ncbi:hypothetical protein Vretimale_3149 [Volvox reticuliferus]|uniref:CTLH domain-containing protein n=1 Tax=Volvox reticuliferus TaxID=1737510 RepID=A0A8J4FMS3_9CHLO|nr:hypothetical protein Vretifemale_6595 [Volvox reticuliferus]GIL97485.1 hypothetical protein Vretimale_3149 [Volvox reticuliferus]
MASIIETLEAPLLRVPFESLKRAAKDRKALVDDSCEYVAALKAPLILAAGALGHPLPTGPAVTPASEDTEMPDAEACAEPNGPTARPRSSRNFFSPSAGAGASLPDAEPAPCPAEQPSADTSTATSTAREASIERLRLLLFQLQGVKRKLADVSRTEADDCTRCKARLEHLSAVRPGQEPGVGLGLIPWTRQRLDILLVDHLLRSGHYDTANRLATSSGISLLTDAHIFEGARRIVSALLDTHDCGPALEWCRENRARLAKAKSPLEFKLHVQRFIELVRAGNRTAAIAYARAHLAPWAGQYMADLQRAVATLVFTAQTRCDAYRTLFDESQWHVLSDLFLRDLYRLHSLTPESLLNVHLQAGLSALKTPASGEPGGSREDPLRLPAFQRLAAQLPYAKHTHSKLLCAVTKELMSDANPPVVLPNGMVYSQRGVELLMAQYQVTQQGSGGDAAAAAAAAATAAAAVHGQAGGGGPPGSIGVCPATGLVFRRDELRRAFIA